MRRLLLAVIAAALGIVFIFGPASAQDLPDPEGQITEGSWQGSQFDDEDMRAGAATRTKTTVTVSGVFKQSARDIEDITASATDPEDEDCQLDIEKPTVEGPQRERRFSFQITSTCNVTTRLEVRAAAGTIGPWYEHLRADLTFAVPSAHPVTDVAATVENTDSRKVDVSWAFPDETEPDTTYVVQRLGPDPGEDAEWVDVSDALTIDDEPSLVDDLTPSESNNEEAEPVTGAYRYRIIAVRPHADATYDSDEIADVYVGVPPTTTTTTTTTTPSSSTVTQPGSATTITVPRLGSSQTPDRNSTHTTVTIAPQSPVTTIDTGFEETLDYGERDDSEPGELAAEGQSIISSDDESVVGPGAVAASLMVLVGWAGHVVYFRRLAAQF